MFGVHEDTWIGFRYRTEVAGWFEMIVVARSYDVRHRDGVVYSHWPAPADREPGRWHTACLRLADFRVVQRPVVPGPLIGFVLGLNSGERDVGLTVERVWVGRGAGPPPLPD